MEGTQTTPKKSSGFFLAYVLGKLAPKIAENKVLSGFLHSRYLNIFGEILAVCPAPEKPSNSYLWLAVGTGDFRPSSQYSNEKRVGSSKNRINFLEPNWPLFWGLTFHFMGQIFQNMGHLGSRLLVLHVEVKEPLLSAIYNH